MANFIMNLGGLIASVTVPLLSMPHEPDSTSITSFEIGLGGIHGIDNNTGGSVPHIAAWDIDGNRIGQYRGNANGHYSSIKKYEIPIDNDQTIPKGDARQPEYVLLPMQESDAICISYIFASGNGVQWAWFGDVGYTCGADWFPSNFKVGSANLTPHCVWLDQDHSNGLRYQGLSLHMPDFSSSDQLVDEYNNDLDTLCKSSRRMQFHPSVVPDAEISFFKPPLTYTSGGADVDPSLVIDKDKRRSIASSRPFRRDNSNSKPGHLIVSSIPRHSAKEVCESATSFGPDFVSLIEGIYCDMDTKEWWYLCSSTITSGCFDLDSQRMVGNAAALEETGHKASGVQVRDEATGRILPDKSYETSESWD